MGWRFRKSIKIAPGIKINIGKKGISSLSVGPRGAHINVGKNGTNLSTGIPGTGLYNVTRLDKPSGRGMTQCPYCGHRMRKQWDYCPTCHSPLTKQIECNKPNHEDEPKIIDAEARLIDNQPPSPPANIPPKGNNSKKSFGCGTILFIFFCMVFLIGSCSNSHKNDQTNHNYQTPVTQEKSSNTSSKSEVVIPPLKTASPNNNGNINNAQTATSNKRNNSASHNNQKVETSYVGNAHSRIFHKSGCNYVRRMSTSNMVDFNKRTDAINAGYRPCKKCCP